MVLNMDDTKNDAKAIGRISSGEVIGELSLPKDTMDFFKGDQIRSRVFFEKYALKDEHGMTVETTPQQMWERVAREIGGTELSEEKRKEWTAKFMNSSVIFTLMFAYLTFARFLLTLMNCIMSGWSTLRVIMRAPRLPFCPIVCVVSLNRFMKDTDPVDTIAELLTGVFAGLSTPTSVPTPPP